MRVYYDFNQLADFKKAVITIGSFDGVHLGHRRILNKVRSLAQEINGESIVITFDPHPRTLLNPEDNSFKLLNNLDEKIELLEALGIDHVVVVPFSKAFANQSAERYVEQFLIHLFHPSYIVIGYDHRFGADRAGDINFLKKYADKGAFQVVEIPAWEVDEIAVSSSKIRKALDRSDLPLANKLLGYPFMLKGVVIVGDRIGRTIGFPTANIEIADPHKLVLPEGIYAAYAYTEDGGKFAAMLYIGKRPTVEANGNRVIEVNLLQYSEDLYGQSLKVEVIDFIRGDKKLDGLEALQAQIKADQQAIEDRLAVEGTSDLGDVAIVILNYNTQKHLETYLPSVLAYSKGARIVVADNGSPDDSVAYLRSNFPQVEVIELTQNYGFAQGYNEALKQVDAEFYVILNSDVEVTEGWLKPIITAMKADPTIGVAQPKIRAWSNRDTFEYAGASGGWIDYLGYPFCRGRIFSHLEEDNGQYDTPQQCLWATGAAFFIRADLYHTFGGFDGDYFAHNEEIDLCWRLKRAGYSVWCFPESVVYHLGGGTLEYENPRKVFLNFRNSLYTLIKNEPWSKLCWLLPARLVLDGVAGLRFLVKKDFPAVWAIVRAHFSLYNNIRKTLQKRKETTQIVFYQKLGKANKEGIYPKSIIFNYYIKGKKRFSDL